MLITVKTYSLVVARYFKNQKSLVCLILMIHNAILAEYETTTFQ